MTENPDQQTDSSTRAHVPLRTVAGRYALLEELGRGGMGLVWRGEDTVIGRHVAVKELRLPDGAEDAGVFSERILREVRTGGRLNDPAVVTVFDVVADGDATFIVMELVEAPTLSDLVDRRGPLPVHEVARIGDQVLSALEAAHRAGIVHRDVKPGNIMVAPNGRVKLTDFGIAQAVDDPRITTSGMLVGSPAFMAPERVAGQEALAASDLWSLGATLYFAAEGALPFQRSTTAATLHAIMHEMPSLARAHGPLASAIMGLLSAAPEARVPAGQARGLLTAAAQPGVAQPGPQTPPGGDAQATAVHEGGPPTLAAAQGAGARPVPRGRRRLLLAGGAVAAVALLVGGFFAGKPFWGPATDDAMAETLTYGRGGDIESYSLDTGSDYCVNTPLAAGRALASSNWVDCEDEAHDAQLFEVAAAAPESRDSDAAAATYPGQDRLRAFAEAKCTATFHTNRVDDEARPALRFLALVPTEAAWNREPADEYASPVRNVLCFLIPGEGGRLEGSATRNIS
ncbi:serine/threonine-protein kinase [Prauserella halophila]|uniref:non-specific serine/threonine protein kinase n=1 Tax=Prauserella halophila TaxID=185641 RepID=A0ABN1VV35_9PSEU|nr:serine/threonine-protein kinase [Prauserella halophila]MCP2234407.1 Serine/threonine protein kinase [Prauserella halophila]